LQGHSRFDEAVSDSPSGAGLETNVCKPRPNFVIKLRLFRPARYVYRMMVTDRLIEVPIGSGLPGSIDWRESDNKKNWRYHEVFVAADKMSGRVLCRPLVDANLSQRGMYSGWLFKGICGAQAFFRGFIPRAGRRDLC
jgi:hypothetical protein